MEKLRKTDSRRVASVAVCRGGKYLFGKRRDNGKWTMPGGHLLAGERSENGAARELLEETGLEPAGNLEKLGAAEVPGRDLMVYSFTCGADGEPDASADPDKEFGEFKWFDLDDLPPAEEHHVPPDKNVTLKLLAGEELSKSMTPSWKSRDGLKIPKAGTAERQSWDDKFHRKVVEVFAGGDANRLRPLDIPVNVPTGSNRAVNADRLRLYTRMARAGEQLPPVVVRKSGQGYHLIDGNHRQAAAIKAGHTHLHALELIDAPVKKSEDLEKADLVASKPIPVQHYGTVPGLKELDPSFQGSGAAGQERNRPKRIPRTYYYLRPGVPEAHVAGGSTYLYHGELPKGTRLYDMGKDVMGLMAGKWRQTKQGMMYDAPDRDRAEKKIKSLGYHGYHNYGTKDALVYFHPLPVRHITDAKKSEDLDKSIASTVAAGHTHLHALELIDAPVKKSEVNHDPEHVRSLIEKEFIPSHQHLIGSFCGDQAQNLVHFLRNKGYRDAWVPSNTTGHQFVAFGQDSHIADTWEPGDGMKAKVWPTASIQAQDPDYRWSENLDKSIAATVAAGLMALSQPKMPEPVDHSSHRIYQKAWSAEGLHPELFPIAHLESSFGQNIRHSPHTGGEFHTAVGALGLKPVTAHEEYLKSPALQQHFPGLTDKNLFVGKLKSEPGFYNAVAGAHWLHLKSIHGSAAKAAYAWRHGTGAAKHVDDSKLMQDPYVKGYQKLSGFRLIKAMHPAFRDPDSGKVHETPGFHDIEALPEDIREKPLEEGFTDSDGNFIPREKAVEEVKKSEFLPVDPLKTSDLAVDRILALKSRHVQPSDLKAALEDEDPEVRTAAALHPQLTPELIGQTLQGDDQHLKSVVLTRPDLRSEDLQHCLHDPELSHLVLKHPALSETQRLHAAINTELPIEHRVAALANNFGNIAKNIGYITYPNLGVSTAGHDTITVPADKRDTYLRIQSRNPGAAPATALGGTSYSSKEIGSIPPERRSVRAFAATGVTGSPKTLAGNEGHENQHAVFAKLKQRYGRSAVKSLIHQAKSSLEPGHQELIDKLFDFPKQRYYKDKPDKWEEESITHLQNYLQDPDFRTAVHNHLGLTPEQGIASQVEARKAWKALVRHGQTITPEHLGVSLRKTEEVIHDWVTDVVITAETLAKGKKDALQMYGADAPGKAEAKQHVDWAYNTMPNENWSLWSVRHHRQKPEDFTPAVKNKIKHYASQSSVPEIANVRFEKHHDLNTGLGMLDAAEKQYHHRLKSQLKLAPRPKTAKKVLDVGDGYAWWDLGKQQCRDEGSAMGHCGNAGSPREGDSILSLRKEHKIGKTKYYEPHLTFIRNGQTIGEMKGRGNEKPAPHYHEKVASLLEHTGLLPVGGGYAPQNNFHVGDLPEALYQRVAAKNPGVKFFKTGELSPDTADALVSTGDQRVLYHLASHPNLPEKNQRQLLADPRHIYDTTVASNTNLAPDLQKELLSHPAVQVRQQLASNQGLDPRHHAALAQDRHVAVPQKLALNEKISPEAQDILISNSSPASGYSVHTFNYLASNKGLEPRNQLRLAQLADSPDFNHGEGNYIHENLGQQPKLTPEAQEILVMSPSHEARRILARNPSLDPKYHQRLADPQRQTSDTREGLASNPNLDPGAQGMLLMDTDWRGARVKRALADNPAFKDPKMQEELLRQFSLDDNSVSSRAIENLASNPSLHPDLQTKLIEDNAFAGHLAANPSLLPELQRKLLQEPMKKVVGDVRFDLARNPGIAPDVQDALVEQGLSDKDDVYTIQNGLALNTSLKPENAIRMAQHATDYAKEYLAENPSTPIEALNILVKDPEERVRRFAAKHPTYVASLKKSEPDYQEPEASLGESHPHDDSMWSEDLPVGDIHDVLGPLQDNSHDHLGHNNILSEAVAAATFLTGRTVSPDSLREYLMAADGDPREAVINAYGLNTPEGRKSMDGIDLIREVRKSIDLNSAPKSVVSLVDHPEVAAAVMKAFHDNKAEDVKLGGKHSSGTKIVEDLDGNIWLLKPGSGKPSPAAGVSDSPISQSRREAGFSAVAHQWGVSEVPDVVLLAIDGREVAAIRMLPPDWVGLFRAGAQDAGLVRRVLEPYRKSGTLHHWAVLDWVLGNADRHGQNLLVGPARDGNPVALIDHGSAFAGPEFSPGTDKNSFVAYYLRAWAPPGFHGRHPADQSRDMPVLDEHADAALRAWVRSLSAEELGATLIKYGIDPKACLDRLAKVKAGLESDNFSRYVNHLWLAEPSKH